VCAPFSIAHVLLVWKSGPLRTPLKVLQYQAFVFEAAPDVGCTNRTVEFSSPYRLFLVEASP